jgi:hypothetical protein
MQQNRNPYPGMQISTTIMEGSMEIPQKAKNRTASDTIPRHLPKGM